MGLFPPTLLANLLTTLTVPSSMLSKSAKSDYNLNNIGQEAQSDRLLSDIPKAAAEIWQEQPALWTRWKSSIIPIL